MARIFDGKVAIVTGGGKGGGIGFGISTAYAKEGCNLTITGRNVAKMEDAKEELERLYGIRVLVCRADGADESQVMSVIERTVAEFGRIDVLINNAMASASGKMLIEHSKEDIDIAINSGIYATFFYMKHAFPHLKETQGSVINFASGAGLFGKVAQSSYAAAKEAIRGISRVAATEWGEYNVNTNVVCPLVMTDKLASWKEEYPEAFKATVKAVPMGRFGDPERDIGRLCVFLGSEDASYISGETIVIQGGSGLRP